MELEKAEQDIIILGHLEMHRRKDYLKNEYKKLSAKSHYATNDLLLKHKIPYYFADVPICRTIYLFLHDLGLKRYKNIIEHYDQYGIAQRIHKSSGKASNRKNVVQASDIQNIVKFINTYAEKVAVPLPGRMPQFRDYKVMKLPSTDTKSSIYRKYVNAANDCQPPLRLVKQRTFECIWSTYCPYIATMKPADDLCDVCRQKYLEISRSANLSEEEKFSKIKAQSDHLERAKIQRDSYNQHRIEAKSTENSSSKVLSFDYAQNVSYPSSPQQVGSSYFKALRKCSIFGIQDEATHIQTNILIDENDNVGKGANCVISMLDYYLDNITAKKIVLYSDNCVGQNKNNAVVHYLLWRVMTKKMNTYLSISC